MPVAGEKENKKPLLKELRSF